MDRKAFFQCESKSSPSVSPVFEAQLINQRYNSPVNTLSTSNRVSCTRDEGES